MAGLHVQRAGRVIAMIASISFPWAFAFHASPTKKPHKNATDKPISQPVSVITHPLN